MTLLKENEIVNHSSTELPCPPIKIAIVTKNSFTQSGLGLFLSEGGLAKVFHATGSVHECIEEWKMAEEKDRPEVLFIAAAIKDLHYMEAITRFRILDPNLRIIFMGDRNNSIDFIQLLCLGIYGFIDESAGKSICRYALRTVGHNKNYFIHSHGRYMETCTVFNDIQKEKKYPNAVISTEG